MLKFAYKVQTVLSYLSASLHSLLISPFPSNVLGQFSVSYFDRRCVINVERISVKATLRAAWLGAQAAL